MQGNMTPNGSLKTTHIKSPNVSRWERFTSVTKYIWSKRMRRFRWVKDINYTTSRAKDYLTKFPARLWWTIKAIPSGLRGELTMAYCTLSAVKYGADGSITDYGVVSRKKVTRTFVLDIVDAMVDSTGAGQHVTFNDYKYHDSGVGTTAEANTDTAIETTDGESRVAGTQVDASTASAGIYRSVGTIAYTTTKAITEHGLFNASSSGQLCDRSVFSAINVVNGDSIQFTYELTINPES